MVLPTAVDAEILPGIAFALEAGLFQQPHGRRVGRNAGRFQPVQPNGVERERDQGANPCRHIALAREWKPDPIAETAGLRDAAADISQGDAPDQHVVAVAEDEKRISLIGAQILGIALEPAPERAAGEIVSRPSGLPWAEKIAAEFT